MPRSKDDLSGLRRKAAPMPPPEGMPPCEPGAARRLPKDEREKRIIEGAIQFFAERGFEGQTRELAKRLGITQPLLYRYFPTKDDLIDRVYQDLYVKRWQPVWEEWILDRSQPIDRRMKRFYKDYAASILTYEWMRIFLYSGLAGFDINNRYLTLIRDRVLVKLCGEWRHEFGLPDPTALPIGEAELELAWALHGAIIYLGIRHFIYGLKVPRNFDPLIEADIDVFLAGLPGKLAALTREMAAE
ncbi:TetR/AcrR family transcriptional regulator [Oceanibaculum pacificum]|nr:TetR/AcrR family transcriptional regulator [Oceanibaculum pacificum]